MSSGTPGEEQASDLDEKRLPLIEHLRELRTRVTRAAIYVLLAFVAGWTFHEPLWAWVASPYSRVDPSAVGLTGHELAFKSLSEPVIVYLKTAGLFAVIVSLPLVVLEAWLFVAPGLYKNERRLTIPFLLSSIVCFVGGAAFCRYLVLDAAVQVLMGFGGEGTTAMLMMDEYFSFTARMLLAFGVLFELPVVLSFLTLIGLVNHRQLMRAWRFAVVAAFIVGGIMTPPDPLTQVALAVPLVALYFVSVGFSYLIGAGRQQAAP
ncbi:MAG: twin-arginine translocase subunit TatC [Myxococcales bacterium]|nr:twin-arginine translocase subunit TatC [Myxococcales bacterium]MCB9534390.1 twin-arginine translocase subunit TatC [Myxococcales bacterium]